ncbi:MAG: hypothetical protein IPJ19_00355 [Planctomycetes bacterium]|nr:hypothetical protein [Planctomycetota bacterium]
MKLSIALGLAASLFAAFAAARGVASVSHTDAFALPSVQSGPGTSTRQSIGLTEELRSQDNIHGLQLVVSAGNGQRLFELSPYAPPPQYAAHLHGQASPVRVVLRQEIGSRTKDALFEQNGSTWSLVVADAQFLLVPGARYTVLAWNAGQGMGEIDSAVFYRGLEL